MSNPKTRYDLESDCLTVKKKDSKIKQSASLGNMTLDFDNKGRVAGIQLLNASKIMKFPENIESPEEFLQNIENAELEQKWFEDGILVVVEVYREQDGEQQEAIINNTAPNLAMA